MSVSKSGSRGIVSGIRRLHPVGGHYLFNLLWSVSRTATRPKIRLKRWRRKKRCRLGPKNCLSGLSFFFLLNCLSTLLYLSGIRTKWARQTMSGETVRKRTRREPTDGRANECPPEEGNIGHWLSSCWFLLFSFSVFLILFLLLGNSGLSAGVLPLLIN